MAIIVIIMNYQMLYNIRKSNKRIILKQIYATHFLRLSSDRNDNDNVDGTDKIMHETRPSVKHTNDTDKSTTLIAGRGKNPISREW